MTTTVRAYVEPEIDTWKKQYRKNRASMFGHGTYNLSLLFGNLHALVEQLPVNCSIEPARILSLFAIAQRQRGQREEKDDNSRPVHAHWKIPGTSRKQVGITAVTR